MDLVRDVERFIRRLERYDARYFRHKAYDSPLRGMIESQIDCWRLKKRHPGLHEEFLRKQKGLTGRLSPFHEEYVSGVSSDIMAASPSPVVWWVDDSQEWLEKTHSYLVSRDVDAKDLDLWDDLIRRKPDPFDLILCDLGGFDFHKDTFETVLGFLENRGALVVDDMHSAVYGLHVRKIVAESGTEHFSMWRHTHDKFGRYSMLVFRNDPP